MLIPFVEFLLSSRGSCSCWVIFGFSIRQSKLSWSLWLNPQKFPSKSQIFGEKRPIDKNKIVIKKQEPSIQVS